MTWLRLNLPPPRQARWEAAPRRNAGPVATELVSVENRLDFWAVGFAHRTYVFWRRVASAFRGCDAETHSSNK